MNDRILQEFYCNDCDGFFLANLCIALNVRVEVVCPNCGRKHHGWGTFAAAVLPPEASDVQRREMEKAFYAGAWLALCQFEASGMPDVPVKTAIEHMLSLKGECIAFKTRLLRQAEAQN